MTTEGIAMGGGGGVGHEHKVFSILIRVRGWVP